MNDLTDKWKKGELPDGMYYMENTSGIIGRVGHSKAFPCYNVKQILAPVPSYDEWKFAQEQLHKEGTWYTERAYKTVKKDAKILAQTLLKVSPEHKAWLDKNYKEYL